MKMTGTILLLLVVVLGISISSSRSIVLLLVIVLGLSIPSSKAYKLCYNCVGGAAPADCVNITKCSDQEACFEEIVINNLNTQYHSGCRSKTLCHAGLIIQKRSAGDVIVCSKCCDNYFCNVGLCAGAVTHIATTRRTAQAHITLPTTTVSSLLPPHISGLMTINLNADTILTCNSNEPGVTYTWLYQGSNSLPLGVSIISGNHLVIIGAKSSNVGTFTCVINKNGHQAASKTNVTIISEKAHVTSVVASPNHPQTGNTVDIHCDATGHPDPAIYWSYTDTMGIPYIPISTSFPDPTTIRIVNFQPSLHGGTWSCIAKNSMGVDKLSIQM